jgi:outer membrane protein assembly factor BamB
MKMNIVCSMVRRKVSTVARVVAVGVTSVALGAWGCGGNGSTDPGSGGKPATLEVVWHTETAATGTSYFQGAPAVDNGMVFVEDGNTVLALDAATGAKRWARPVRVAPIPAARALLARNGVVYVSEVDSVLAMRQSDGSTIWNFHPDSQAVVYPSMDDQALYTGQRGIPFVYALSLTDGHPLWKVNIGTGWTYPGFVNGTAVSGDTVYVAGRRFLAQNGYINKGVLVALDRRDGHELWRYETPGQFGGLQDAPVVAGNLIVASDLLGNGVFAYDRFALREVWRVKRVDNGPLTPPVVVGNDVYSGSADTYLYAIDLQTGALKWQQKSGGSIAGTAFCGGQVFVQDEGLRRRDPQRGGAYTGAFNTGIWPLTSNLTSDGNRLYFTGENGVHAIKCS